MLESDRYFGDLVTLLGRPELATDPRFSDHAARAANSAACVGALDELFAQKTLAEWKPILAKAKGVWAAVQTPSELLVDPRRWPTATSATWRRNRAPSSAWCPHRCSSTRRPPDLTRAPDHGEHTDEVIGELGYDQDALLELKIKGVIL
jgi:crotonobetainyl-CoA:carnitine CoA-transferase CaiB-like acyl-CoA transferase